jgi:hypothetical protein
MHIRYSPTVKKSLSRTHRIREAVLLTFCDPVPSEECALLHHLSRKEWHQLLHWLDRNGLALYFLDRLEEQKMTSMLPPMVLARLQQNLANNKVKTAAMIAECRAIHYSFQLAGLSYAMLKGFSLWPVTVPKPELRLQTDFDFLLSEEHIQDAQQILEARGYYLHAVSGRTWEFKGYHTHRHTAGELYKPTAPRKVELHLEGRNAEGGSLLARTVKMDFRGLCMPVLSSVDILLGQGMHVYKHLRYDSTRVAHLVEFRRHIIARYHQDAFWKELQALVEDNPKESFALGFVILFLERVMGRFAPEAFTSWTVDKLPPAARLWVNLYARIAVFRFPSATKLYLLLQNELQQNGVSAKLPLRRVLLPFHLPEAISRGGPDEVWSSRIRRYTDQVRFIWFRLHFHLREGLRYFVESIRWRYCVKKLATRTCQLPDDG